MTDHHAGPAPRNPFTFPYRGTTDLDCPHCQRRMIRVHGHMECRGPGGCGYRDSCCDGGEC